MPNWKIVAMAVLLTGLLLSALIEPAPPTIYANAQKQSATVRTERGSGSAVVFQRNDFQGSSRYFAWTANHVTDGTVSIQLQTYFRYEGNMAGTSLFDATILAASTNYDLALLWVKAPPGAFVGAVFADDWSVAPGDGVFACGNLLGRFDGSVSTGVISQIGATALTAYWIMVDQTTAPIYPGNSGGGLFNSSGEVIGLVVVRIDATLGFFVPVRAMRVWAQEEGLEWALAGPSCPRDGELQRLARIYQQANQPVVELPAPPVKEAPKESAPKQVMPKRVLPPHRQRGQQHFRN